MDRFVITIGRQFGSGGRSIGEKLAKKLGVKFYDKELISLAAKESGMDPEVFEGVDEKAANSLLYSLSMGMYSFGSGFSAMGDLPVNDKLYILQHKIIKDIADRENCVIVGRCADYVLRDNPNCVNIFIHANMAFRKEQSIQKHGIDAAHAEHIINKTDKSRANYYSFYSGHKWGMVENYDLCIDSSKIDEDKIVDLIAEYVQMR
ncbi:MAG: cytidylate kinase-like family protein [Ruminococcus sp.]|uniref:cytidylate kinase-like family protein n=1 Tax=Ruminococcus sp. TaxID=41978 RepID=UPI0028737E37|nr:cytidylate kinase-like family protein [Ruminococcus sp.]MBQ3284226.1 cytidylate kinase-like family protein [Ruminococcus sp.]